MSKWSAFGKLVKQIAVPILVLVRPELAPIANSITVAIDEAEQIHGAGNGAEKMQHVLKAADAAADVYNATTAPDIDKTKLHTVVEDGVNAVVAATNIVVKSAKLESK
jgi:hypothetical protein